MNTCMKQSPWYDSQPAQQSTSLSQCLQMTPASSMMSDLFDNHESLKCPIVAVHVCAHLETVSMEHGKCWSNHGQILHDLETHDKTQKSFFGRILFYSPKVTTRETYTRKPFSSNSYNILSNSFYENGRFHIANCSSSLN